MFISLSLKISLVQCIENSESRWEKMIHQQTEWSSPLGTKYFLFLCSFLSVVKKRNYTFQILKTENN